MSAEQYLQSPLEALKIGAKTTWNVGTAPIEHMAKSPELRYIARIKLSQTLYKLTKNPQFVIITMAFLNGLFGLKDEESNFKF